MAPAALRSASVLVILLTTPGPPPALSLRNAAEVEFPRGRAISLRDQAHYAEAETLLHRALTIAKERACGDTDRLCGLYNELGVLYKYMGRFDEAGQLYSRALSLVQSAISAVIPSGPPSITTLADWSMRADAMRKGSHSPAVLSPFAKTCLVPIIFRWRPTSPRSRRFSTPGANGSRPPRLCGAVAILE